MKDLKVTIDGDAKSHGMYNILPGIVTSYIFDGAEVIDRVELSVDFGRTLIGCAYKAQIHDKEHKEWVEDYICGQLVGLKSGEGLKGSPCMISSVITSEVVETGLAEVCFSVLIGVYVGQKASMHAAKEKDLIERHFGTNRFGISVAPVGCDCSITCCGVRSIGRNLMAFMVGRDIPKAAVEEMISGSDVYYYVDCTKSDWEDVRGKLVSELVDRFVKSGFHTTEICKEDNNGVVCRWENGSGKSGELGFYREEM